MHKQTTNTVLYFCVVFCFCLVSCTPRQEAINAYPYDTSAEPVVVQPLLTSWSIADDAILSSKSFSLAIHIIRLTREETTVLYSLSEQSSGELLSETKVYIEDDTGHTNSLIRITPVATLNKLELGMMVFEPRHVGAHELYMHVATENQPADIQRMTIARLIGPSEDQAYDIRTYFTVRNGKLQQGDYLISFGGWQAPANETVDYLATPGETNADELAPDTKSTPTPAVSEPLTRLSTGTLQREFSFSIQEVASKNVHNLSVQLFSNGDVVRSLDGEDRAIAQPTPFLAKPESTPTWAYPPP